MAGAQRLMAATMTAKTAGATAMVGIARHNPSSAPTGRSIIPIVQQLEMLVLRPSDAANLATLQIWTETATGSGVNETAMQPLWAAMMFDSAE